MQASFLYLTRASCFNWLRLPDEEFCYLDVQSLILGCAEKYTQAPSPELAEDNRWS